MVHALREAHHVLKPGGILIDLRPATEHRHVGISRDGKYHDVARLLEVLDDDRAANRAVRRVVDEGLYKREQRYKFMVNRYADSLEDFRTWLEEFSDLKPCLRSPRLLPRVERALAAQGEGAKIVARGPLVLQVLRKK